MGQYEKFVEASEGEGWGLPVKRPPHSMLPCGFSEAIVARMQRSGFEGAAGSLSGRKSTRGAMLGG